MARIPITTDKQFEALLKKTAKGVVTATSKKTEQWLKYYTKTNLYGQTLAYESKQKGGYAGIKVHGYKRTKDVLNSITNEGTSFGDDEFYDRVYFDDREFSDIPKTYSSLGAHSNVARTFVGDDMIEYGWLEEGTEDGLIKRRGAYMIRDTIKEVDSFLNRGGVDSEIFSEVGDVVIRKYR